MIEKRDVWFIIGFLLVVIGLLMMISIVKAAPTYSNVGQNLTYVGQGDYIELRAYWTPTADESLDTAILYINLSGNYDDVDYIDLSGNVNESKWSNFSYQTELCGHKLNWYIWANDTSGTNNTTSINSFYVIPYINYTSNSSVIGYDAIDWCPSKHNASIVPSANANCNITVLMPFFERNATFKECSYKVTDATIGRLKITNTSNYCNVSIIGYSSVSGIAFYVEEDTGTSGYPPSNLPSAIAAAGLVIIVIYTITTRKRS